jgi:hypothetical protein
MPDLPILLLLSELLSSAMMGPPRCCGASQAAVFICILLLCVCAHSCVAVTTPVPPVIQGPAFSDLYSAGLYHGMSTKDLIHGWASTSEVVDVVLFTSSQPGFGALQAMKHNNSATFPQLAEYVRGVAEGSEMNEDTIWALNLISEIENIMPDPPPVSRLHRRRSIKHTKLNLGDEPTTPRHSTHCSDVYARSDETFGSDHGHSNNAGLWTGHNEDWSTAVRPYVYFLVEAAAPGANFSSCAGFTYPGSMLGSAITWNDRGMYYTQNAVFPLSSRPYGLGSNFVNRAACDSSSLEELLAASTIPGQSLGFSLNVLDREQQRLVNLEVYEDQSNAWELPKGQLSGSSRYDTAEAVGAALGANGTHFNMYKHLSPLPAQSDPSSIARQSAADRLPPPRNAADIARVLGDTSDPVYPIYKPDTLVTSIVDAQTGNITLWAATNPNSSEPVYQWNLSTFWNETMAKGKL